MAFITDKFFELIQISLGNKNGFEQPPLKVSGGCSSNYHVSIR